MIAYEVYKLIHLSALFTLCAFFGFALSESPWFSKKRAKSLMFFVSILVFVAGMGLIARIGIKHGEGFPAWIQIKIGLWILANVLLVVLLKSKTATLKFVCAAFFVLTLIAAASSAIYKAGI
jgi:hypothetical protein